MLSLALFLLYTVTFHGRVNRLAVWVHVHSLQWTKYVIEPLGFTFTPYSGRST